MCKKSSMNYVPDTIVWFRYLKIFWLEKRRLFSFPRKESSKSKSKKKQPK